MNNQTKRRTPARIMMAPVMDSKRGTLNRIRKIAKRKGWKIDAVRPHTLLLYAKLTTKSPNLTFQPNRGVDSNTPNGSIQLEKSDAFYADKIGLAIHKVPIIGGSENPGNQLLIHYPDPNFFTEANETRDLNTLYNGVLQLQTDTDVRLEEFATKNFLTIPETQYDATAGTGHLWRHDGSEMKDLSVNFGLWGNKRNTIEFKPFDSNYTAWAGAATHQNYAVLLIDGFVMVNGATAVTKSDLAHLM